MYQVTEKLKQRLPGEKITTGVRITHAERVDEKIMLRGSTTHGDRIVVQAEQLLLALPPGLAANIHFTPSLPEALTDEWRHTGTWMAPHAKYVAHFNEAFWLADGLSGEGRSMVGPLVELHDVSVPGGVSALFGFLGIPAQSRQTLGEETVLSLCRAQLVRLFGEKAASPVEEFLKDWSADPFTATPHDLTLQAGHHVPPAFAVEKAWAHVLTGIASEWSPTFPGYLAGAIEAAREGVNRVMAKMRSDNPTFQDWNDTERNSEKDL
ncbi:FAD-dependent oxidoreductase [Enterobacter sp. SA197]